MRRSGYRLKEKTQDRLAEFFVGDVTARSAADLARFNARRPPISFTGCVRLSPGNGDSLPVEVLVEVDESYFGGVRKAKGKRGRSRHPQARRQTPHRDDPRCSQRHSSAHHPAEGRS